MKIIGLDDKEFKLQDGTIIKGKTIWLSYPLDKNRLGKGIGAEKIFLSTAKTTSLPFQLELGMEVDVLYNKFGKVQTLRLVDEGIDFGTGG